MIVTKTEPQAAARPAWTWAEMRQEPYRLFFPLGLVSGAIGMGVWIPFFFFPTRFPFPGQSHAVIQIQSFLLFFIFGFLTTMLPKILGVRPLGPVQYALFPIGLIGVIITASAGMPVASQIIHLLLIGNFIAFVGMRFSSRRGNPPPHFAFIAVAMAADVAGTIIRILAMQGILGAVGLRAGSLLQYQAFPLLLILGVGGFLLPKLFANQDVNPKSLQGNLGVKKVAPWIISFLFLSSYAMEVYGLAHNLGYPALRAAYALRSAVWLWFIFTDVKVHKIKVAGKLPPYLLGAKLSLIVTAVGLFMPVIRPAYLLAWEHVIFLSGFLRLTLSIASRVLAAHSGHLEILAMHRKKARVYGMLIVLAMMSRIATDIWPRGHWMHLAIAATLAITAMGIWAKIYFPLLLKFPGR